MQEVLALGLQAMHRDMQRLDRIGSNLANALTPGYKREVVAAQSMGITAGTFASLVNTLSDGVAMEAAQPHSYIAAPLTIKSDSRPGTLKSTGQSLDVALAGGGYFEVTTDSGPAYTRQGNFQIDAGGRLVTAQGLPVMGKGGEIYLSGPNPVIDAAGNVYESQDINGKTSSLTSTRLLPIGDVGETQAVAQLKVIQIDDVQSFQRLGDGMLSTGGATSLMKDADIQVRQGFLENSNVNSMQEMVQLIQTMRHFESMQKVVLGYDDMTGQAIRKLGELS